MNRISTVVLSMIVLISGCGVRLSRMTDIEKTELLAREKGRLSETADPVNKTKSYIIISDILLNFAGSAAASDGHSSQELERLLDQYTKTIGDARDTLVNSDRKPVKDSEGFREFEIALRTHARVLEGMSQMLSLDQRLPVEKALTAATDIREGILRLLFPG